MLIKRIASLGQMFAKKPPALTHSESAALTGPFRTLSTPGLAASLEAHFANKADDRVAAAAAFHALGPMPQTGGRLDHAVLRRAIAVAKGTEEISKTTLMPAAVGEVLLQDLSGSLSSDQQRVVRWLAGPVASNQQTPAVEKHALRSWVDAPAPAVNTRHPAAVNHVMLMRTAAGNGLLPEMASQNQKWAALHPAEPLWRVVSSSNGENYGLHFEALNEARALQFHGQTFAQMNVRGGMSMHEIVMNWGGPSHDFMAHFGEELTVLPKFVAHVGRHLGLD